jgi:LysR family transcriptional regulator, low CO2-responsive transcriptional regulator
VLLEHFSSITLRQLQIFIAVSRARSFARAAEGLDLSQPAVSVQIKELEGVLGVRLLHRASGRGGVDLTEAGQILLETCEDIGQALERADRSLESLRGLSRGVVSFGAELCFGAYILPRLHNSFRQHFAGITVVPEVDHSFELIDKLRQHRFDLVVVVDAVDDAALVNEPLGGYDVLLVGPPGHRLAQGPAVPFAELAGEQWVLPRNTFVLRDYVDQMATKAGITLQMALEVNHIQAKVQAVNDGVGIAPIGTWGAAAAISAGQAVPLQVQGFPIRLSWFLVHRKGELTPGAQAYRDHLVQNTPLLANEPFEAPALPVAH